MSVATHHSVQLRPVERPAAGHAPAPLSIPMQADWHRICEDLSGLGLVEVRAANSVATLCCLAEPRRTRIGDDVVRIAGPGLELLAALPRLAAASIENSPAFRAADHVLRWYDWAGDEALRVSLTEHSSWSSFHAMLVRQWARRSMPRSVLTGGSDQAPAGMYRLEGSPQGWDSHELSAAWYPTAPGLGHACSAPGVHAVDPSLIAPFLGSMAEQGCGLRVLLGNGALLHCHENDFYDCRGDTDLTLRGSGAWLSVDLELIATAWVVESAVHADMRRSLRLADAHGRVVLTLGAVPTGSSADPWLWRTLLNALLD